jgi:formylmethanofuran dehydrogenase subunit E
MDIDFKGLYIFHGHRCPMSTMGARLGAAAMAALGATKADQFRIEAVFHSKNCALDGIQFVTGCTLGNGNLAYDETGKASLALKKRDGSRAITVSASDTALKRLSGHKELKARLLEEKEVSGLPRAMEIDREISKDFDALVQWVQDAPEDELLAFVGGKVE